MVPLEVSDILMPVLVEKSLPEEVKGWNKNLPFRDALAKIEDTQEIVGEIIADEDCFRQIRVHLVFFWIKT